MAKSLLNKIGNTAKAITAAGAIGLASLFSNQSMAIVDTNGNWNSFSDIVPSVSPVNGNPIGHTTYTSSSTFNANNILSAIYYIYIGTSFKPVGGFDAINGQIVNSSFNSYGVYHGLKPGDVANGNGDVNGDESFNGSNNGYWEVFYDKNGDGNYGEFDSNELPGDFTEVLDALDFFISDFTPYGDANPQFTFTKIPEPSVSLALVTGAGLLHRHLGVSENQAHQKNLEDNIVYLNVKVSSDSMPDHMYTNKVINLGYKDNLRDVDWLNAGKFPVTGIVNRVFDSNTNNSPTRFYRAGVSD